MSAISVEAVSKRFRLQRGAPRTLKDRLVLRGQKVAPPEDFWALREVSFEVAQGETVGLIGHNGSGKSTLLKCVGGILTPTTGSVRVNGRLASLLELGAGFHPDLTGRENVFLNGSILGLSRREVERRFDDIVSFAELEDFIDSPVKFYSSGMYVRLGFAVAVNVEPDVLLVDEVLSVGDEAFQRKCLDKVQSFQRQGRTIVLVSHAVDLVQSICDRAVVLDHGRLVADGDAAEAVTTYRRVLYEPQMRMVDAGDPAPVSDPAGAEPSDPAESSADAMTADGEDGPPAEAPSDLTMGERHEQARTGGVQIVDVWCGPSHHNTTYVESGDELDVVVTYDAAEAIGDAMFGIAIADGRDGKEVYGVNTGLLEVEMPVIEGRGTVTFHLGSVPLLAGSYPVTIGITSQDEGTIYDWREQRHRFEVLARNPGVGMVAFDVEVTVEAEQHQETTHGSA